MARIGGGRWRRWGCWALVGANGACTAAALVSVVPLAVIWPYVAELLADPGAGSALEALARDALLCFGPLAVPPFLALGATALRSAWRREPSAARLNGSAVVAWSGTLAAGWMLVAIG